MKMVLATQDFFSSFTTQTTALCIPTGARSPAVDGKGLLRTFMIPCAVLGLFPTTE